MVLQSDFLLDGADHARLFDFEIDLSKTTDLDTENQKLIGKQKEQRFKTVVCRHWVMDLCMKMDECEYLHELNPARMPECRWGEKCQVPDCVFKHTKEEDRIECAFYRLGFCRKGPTCRFRHVQRAPEECPEEINWEDIDDARQLTLTEVTTMEEGVEKKMLVQHNENYKVSICKHWQKNGSCPFGERCHFAHGQHELRQRGGDDDPSGGTSGPPKTSLQEIVTNFQQAATDAPRNPISDIGEDLQTPDRVKDKGGKPVYFIVRSRDQGQIAASLKHRCWSIIPTLMNKLNEAFEKASQVFLFFACEVSMEFMGCAAIRSPVQIARDVPFVDLPEAAMGYSFLMEVEWLYTCSLPFNKTAYLMSWQQEVLMDLPVAMSFECTELHPSAGHALMVMMYREPFIQVDVAAIGDVSMSVHMEGPDQDLYDVVDDHIEQMDEYIKENPGYLKELRGGGTAEGNTNQTLGPDGVPIGPGSIPVPDRPGFIIGCTSRRFAREMVRNNLLAGPDSRKSDMSIIQRGTFMILFDLEENKIHGIFEALSPAEELLEPRAFLANENDRDAVSELPIQVPVRRAMNAPPIFSRQVPHTVLQTDGGESSCFIRIPAGQMQNIANLFARASGNRNQRSNNAGGSGDVPQLSQEYPTGISVHELPSNKPDTFSRTVIANIPFRPQFKAAHRIIGKGGANIKRIQDAGVRCTVKPLSKDQSDQQEINGPMQVIFFSNDPANLDRAQDLIIEMMTDLEKKHEEYVRIGEQMRNNRGRRFDDRSERNDRHFRHPRDPYDDRESVMSDRGRPQGGRQRHHHQPQHDEGSERERGVKRRRDDEFSVGSMERGRRPPPPFHGRDRDDMRSVASSDRGGRGGRRSREDWSREYDRSSRAGTNDEDRSSVGSGRRNRDRGRDRNNNRGFRGGRRDGGRGGRNNGGGGGNARRRDDRGGDRRRNR